MNPPLEPKRQRQHHNPRSRASTDLPKIPLSFIRIHNPLQVHPKVRGEEGQGQKDYCDDCEEQDGLVVGFGSEREGVLFDGFELEILFM